MAKPKRSRKTSSKRTEVINLKNKKPIIGWREWISLPEIGIEKIKIKVDSGARTSALHADDIDFIKKGRNQYVRFKIFPTQRSKSGFVIAEAPILEKRWVKSSVGHKTLRPVIKTKFSIGAFMHELELTLVNRDMMGFRMLLGREAFKKFFLLDANRSYIIGKNKLKREPQ
jgi:hypothetical protein